MPNVKYSLVASIFYLFSMHSNAVSFDCQKARVNIEKNICSSQLLMDLDSTLSAAYNQAKLTSDPNQLKLQQINWIEQRNQCGDTKCIESLYRSRIDLLLKAITPTDSNAPPIASTIDASNIRNSEKEPLNIVGQFNDFRPQYGTTKIIDGKFYFSQYGKSGNNYDVVSIDIKKLSVEYIAREYPSAIFVAENDKYAIIQTQGTVVRPLVVIDKVTGASVAKLKISSPIIWAKIDNNTLTAIQSGTDKNLIKFRLPDLKITEIANFEASSDLSMWNKNLVVLARGKVNVFDENFNLRSSLTLKNEESIEGNSCAGSPLRVVGDKAILIVNCGNIQIYDLKTQKWERTIPPYDAFYSLAAYRNEFLLVAATTKESTGKMRVFNVNSGKEMAIIPIKGSYIFSHDNYLLSMDFNFSGTSPITVYAINKDPIMSGTYYSNNLFLECQKAADIAQTGDIYKAIDLCEAAGLKGAIRNGDALVGLGKYIRLYGIWLSNTYASATDAIPILEHSIDSQSALITERVTEAKLKSRYIHIEESGNSKLAQVDSSLQGTNSALSNDEKQTEFGKALSVARPASKTVSIDFGSFSNLLYFDRDKVYIGKWEKQVALQVYNRHDFSFIKSIVIEGANDETQPIIDSITTDEKSIFLSIHRRWKDDSNIDFVTIDKKTLEIIKKGSIGVLSLFSDQDKLYSCNCEPYGECHSIDKQSFTFLLEPEWQCISQGTSDQASLARKLPREGQASKDNYQVVKTGQGDLSDSLILHEYPKVFNTPNAKGTISKISIQKEAANGGRTLMDLMHSPNSPPILYVYKNDLYIGNGRDLIVYDVNEYRLKKYMKDFISNERDNNCCGVDQNKITRFLLDHGRLIVITFNGKNSKILNLDN